jgi:hypothetical protein
MLYVDSRYNKEKSFPIPFRGELRTAITFRKIDREIPSGSFLYTIKETDTLDMLAFKFFGVGEYWWYLADLNPHVEPWDLGNYVGVQIWIPPVHKAISKQRITQKIVVNPAQNPPSAYIFG